ncbi:MAG: magnesium transporter, partial [Paracoccaceae bacterium]
MNQDIMKEDAPDEDTYVLDRAVVAAVLQAVEQGDNAALTRLMEPLHAADIADLLEQISEAERHDLVQLYGREFDGEILTELDEGLREEVIGVLHPQVLADAVRELESDDVVDLLEDMDEPQQEAILEVLEDVDRVAVEQALSYPEFSAGRLMQREIVMAPDHWNVGQAVDFMRSSEDLPSQFYHMVLVNPRLEPVGHVALGRLLATRRDIRLATLCEEEFRTFEVNEPEADVAYAFNQYHLISAPVVDADQRLVGVITIDDAMSVLDDEHEEDILRLAGVGDSSLTDKAFDTLRRRFPWLAVNLVTAILASVVIAQFEETITQFVALAVLMPIVASMGGNA